MDKNWSEMNKEIRVLLSKEATLNQAIEKLTAFRADMFEQIRRIVMSYPEEAFWQMPFAGADGYHSKIESCSKGFYIPSNDGANAAKAQALYIRKHGKKEFLKVHDRLHEKYDFARSQEILGQDYMEGLRILEEN